MKHYETFWGNVLCKNVKKDAPSVFAQAKRRLGKQTTGQPLRNKNGSTKTPHKTTDNHYVGSCNTPSPLDARLLANKTVIVLPNYLGILLLLKRPTVRQVVFFNKKGSVPKDRPEFELCYARRIPRSISTIANLSTSGTTRTCMPCVSFAASSSPTTTLTLFSPMLNTANFSVP